MTDDEHKTRSIQVITHYGDNGFADTKEMFLLYNERLKPRETNMSCGGCRQRVYDKLKKYYGI